MERKIEFRLLSIKEAAALLGKPEDWLRYQLRQGKGPPAKRVSERCIQIRQDDLWRWLDSLECVSRPRLRAEPDPELTIDLGDGGDG